MSVTMSRIEREAFLADVHVGILSVHEDGRGPLTLPIWYAYEPGGTVNLITGAGTRKARLLAAAGRFSLCVQTETPPYKYVSVEGPIVGTEADVTPSERTALAYRYLGPEFGDLYLAATADRDTSSVVIRMTPEKWLTTDFAKEFA
ncbi:MAG TPA: pyridoxamine 5'-phosphate oxidase family protein [Acidimicrobiales bacterium]|jgi:nitroimidazol reductase NimA-like FMN-containing flavoprotein (pyridoxamine 5'-phosphate oxidase superfamily)